IIRNGTITLFNEGKLIRDFTYVDDIVSGLAGAIYRREDDKVIVYNLGNSKPVLSRTFLETLEKILNKKANVKYEVSLADMPITYANSSLAFQNLNYVAQTSIEEGLQKFVDWYRQHESEVIPCDSECSYDDMCFKSLWDAAAATSRMLTAECSLVVYTVSTQSSVVSLPPAAESTAGCNIAFVSKHSTIWKAQLADRSSKKGATLQHAPHNNWQLVPVGSLAAFGDSRKATRLPKLSPGLFFSPAVNHAIYLDYSNMLTMEPRYYVETLLKDSMGRRAVMASVRNPVSASMFDEFQAVQTTARVKPDVSHFPKKLEQQKRAYEAYQSSVPGLKYDNVFDGGFLVHDLKWDQAKKFRCTWYREYQDWADRDQVAGAFVLSKMSHELDSSILGSQSEWVPVLKDSVGSAYVHILPSSMHPGRHPNPNVADTLFSTTPAASLRHQQR
ncbi:capI, partial [Symbiodinium microadriaticum]